MPTKIAEHILEVYVRAVFHISTTSLLSIENINLLVNRCPEILRRKEFMNVSFHLTFKISYILWHFE